ncbi:MAG: AmpG family muropeptide MFS transporter [Thermodesulfobacteriota bacterium]
MSSDGAAHQHGRDWTALQRSIFNRKMLVAFLMGFSCGLPLLLTMGVLQAWMNDEGIDLTLIGLMALVQLPYTIKFLWSPILDRFTLPFLGRRRGWLLAAQVLLAGSIALMGLSNPSENIGFLVLASFLVTFFSASQDIVVDAYRREDLEDKELGLGSTMYVYGYRIAMVLASGGGLILADQVSFRTVYLILAAVMSIGIMTTVFTPEPKAEQGVPRTIREAVIHPFLEYFTRSSTGYALLLLGFILFYKIGDQMAGAMTTPFYLDLGFSKTEIGAIVKAFGTWATFIGIFLGGVILLRSGILRSLWIFGLLQAASTAGFAVLNLIGHSQMALGVVVTFENLTGGMGTSAYVAFMASITNKRFTATQYALLTSLMGIPRVLASAPTGFMAKQIGWTGFFIFCTLIALPGLLMLPAINRGQVREEESPARA